MLHDFFYAVFPFIISFNSDCAFGHIDNSIPMLWHISGHGDAGMAITAVQFTAYTSKLPRRTTVT